MEYQGHGCGGLLRKFGNEQSLIVARGRILHYGYQYLYEWGHDVKPEADGTTANNKLFAGKPLIVRKKQKIRKRKKQKLKKQRLQELKKLKKQEQIKEKLRKKKQTNMNQKNNNKNNNKNNKNNNKNNND